MLIRFCWNVYKIKKQKLLNNIISYLFEAIISIIICLDETKLKFLYFCYSSDLTICRKNCFVFIIFLNMLQQVRK